MSKDLPGTPVGKPIGFKTLQEVVGYMSIHDGNVLKVTVNIVKMTTLEGKDQSGMPMYHVVHQVNVAAITREEYEAMISRDSGI